MLHSDEWRICHFSPKSLLFGKQFFLSFQLFLHQSRAFAACIPQHPSMLDDITDYSFRLIQLSILYFSKNCDSRKRKKIKQKERLKTKKQKNLQLRLLVSKFLFFGFLLSFSLQLSAGFCSLAVRIQLTAFGFQLALQPYNEV